MCMDGSISYTLLRIPVRCPRGRIYFRRVEWSGGRAESILPGSSGECFETERSEVTGVERASEKFCRRGHRGTTGAVTLEVFGLARRRGVRSLRTDTWRHVQKVVPHPVLNIRVV